MLSLCHSFPVGICFGCVCVCASVCKQPRANLLGVKSTRLKGYVLKRMCDTYACAGVGLKITVSLIA